MGWVYLDDRFTEHPKVQALSDAAFRLHVAALCMARRDMSARCPGGVNRVALPSLARGSRRRAQWAAELVRAGLWETHPDGWVIHDWAEWNRVSMSRSEAGRKAAAARWGRAKRRMPDALPTHDASASESHITTDAQSLSLSLSNKSSSVEPGGARPVDEDEEDIHKLPDDDPLAWLTEPVASPVTDHRVTAAVAALAYQDLLRRQAAPGTPVADPASWLKTAQARRLEQDGPALTEYANAHPDASITELAQQAHTTPSGQARGTNATAHDDQQAAMLAKAREWKPSAEPMPASPDEQARGIAKARRTLGPPER